MKRAALFVVVMVLTVSVSALAQTAARGASQEPVRPAVGPAFVDANGDGICDNVAARGARQGRGMGRGMGAGVGRGMRGGFGAGLAFGRNGESLIDVTSRVTAMAPGDVLAALRTGRTFAQIAEDHGKSAQDLVQAALTARQEMLAKAVSEGRLTQDQADQMVSRMKVHLEQQVSTAWQPRGRGFGGQCPWGAGAPVGSVKK